MLSGFVAVDRLLTAGIVQQSRSNLVEFVSIFNDENSPGRLTATAGHRKPQFSVALKVDVTGFEPVANSQGNMEFSGLGGAESGAVDERLSELIRIWPALPEDVLAKILEMVKTWFNGQ